MTEKMLLYRECLPQTCVQCNQDVGNILSKTNCKDIASLAQLDWLVLINFVFPSPHNWVDVFHVVGFFAV